MTNYPKMRTGTGFQMLAGNGHRDWHTRAVAGPGCRGPAGAVRVTATVQVADSPAAPPQNFGSASGGPGPGPARCVDSERRRPASLG